MVNDNIYKWCLMANKDNDTDSMYKLGYYYEYSKIDYKLMKYYYLKAIDNGHVCSLYELGKYYQFIEQNYDLMKKYYLMAIDKGNIITKYYLGLYYEYSGINNNLMKKYYLSYHKCPPQTKRAIIRIYNIYKNNYYNFL